MFRTQKGKLVSWLGAAGIAVSSVSCGSSPVTTIDDEPAETRGKADTGGIREGSLEADGILKVANESSYRALCNEKEAGLCSLGYNGWRATTNILAYRRGDNPSERKTFSSLTELDNVPFVGPRTFAKLLDYAKRKGWVASYSCVVRKVDGVMAGETYKVRNIREAYYADNGTLQAEVYRFTQDADHSPEIAWANKDAELKELLADPDARGLIPRQKFLYQNDALGRPVQMSQNTVNATDPRSMLETLTYDANGLLLTDREVTKSAGNTPADRLLSRIWEVERAATGEERAATVYRMLGSRPSYQKLRVETTPGADGRPAHKRLVLVDEQAKTSKPIYDFELRYTVEQGRAVKVEWIETLNQALTVTFDYAYNAAGKVLTEKRTIAYDVSTEAGTLAVVNPGLKDHRSAKSERVTTFNYDASGKLSGKSVSASWLGKIEMGGGMVNLDMGMNATCEFDQANRLVRAHRVETGTPVPSGGDKVERELLTVTSPGCDAVLAKGAPIPTNPLRGNSALDAGCDAWHDLNDGTFDFGGADELFLSLYGGLDSLPVE
ncbi:MAG: hypothetical protein IT371_09340 [Deltaproteobacteria bacterium]|nr:hypothetical protein [Deltaproteobacteria bacterium]